MSSASLDSSFGVDDTPVDEPRAMRTWNVESHARGREMLNEVASALMPTDPTWSAVDALPSTIKFKERNDDYRRAGEAIANGLARLPEEKLASFEWLFQGDVRLHLSQAHSTHA